MLVLLSLPPFLWELIIFSPFGIRKDKKKKQKKTVSHCLRKIAVRKSTVETSLKCGRFRCLYLIALHFISVLRILKGTGLSQRSLSGCDFRKDSKKKKSKKKNRKKKKLIRANEPA